MRFPVIAVFPQTAHFLDIILLVVREILHSLSLVQDEPFDKKNSPRAQLLYF